MDRQKIEYGEADIRRYREGQMGPAEMHALEAAALNDPFLGDALEGYLTTPHSAAHLQGLHTVLEARIRKDERKKAPVFPITGSKVWRVAALFILVAGIGWIAYRLPFSGQKDIAMQKGEARATAKKETTAKNATADSTSSTYKTTALEPTQAPVAKVFSRSPLQQKNAAKKIVFPQADTWNRKSIALNNDKELREDTQNRVVDAIQRSKESKAVASASVPAQSMNGKVVDNTGNAVPYANVTIRGLRTTTQTDTNGNFTVTVPDSIANATVSAAGYQSNQVFLSPLAQNQVILNRQSASLEEVVVSANTPRAKKRAAVTVVEGQLEPKEGWTRYNDYLAENLSEPDKMDTKPASGEVSLTFDVNNDGEPINIRVEKSLCPVCDLKAVRLLKEGPKWKPGKGKKGSIVIRF